VGWIGGAVSHPAVGVLDDGAEFVDGGDHEDPVAERDVDEGGLVAGGEVAEAIEEAPGSTTTAAPVMWRAARCFSRRAGARWLCVLDPTTRRRRVLRERDPTTLCFHRGRRANPAKTQSDPRRAGRRSKC